MKSQIQRQKREKIPKSDPSQVHPTKNFAQSHLHTNIYETIIIDILHQLYKGIVEYIKDWVYKYLDNCKVGRKSAKAVEEVPFVIRLDHQFQQVPPFTGLKRFHNQQFSKVRQQTGNEYQDKIRQYAVVIAPLITNEDAEAMLFIRAVLDFVTLLEY